MWNQVIQAYEKNEQPLKTSQHLDVSVTADNEKKSIQVKELDTVPYPQSKSRFSMYLERSM